METLNLGILNPGPILTDMRDQLQSLAALPHYYLRRPTPSGSADFSIWDFGLNPLGVRESALPEVPQLIGIRSLTLNTAQDLSPLHRLSAAIPHSGNEEGKWRYLMSDTVTRVLQPLLSNCRTIAFHDWASLSGASDLWDNLLRGVIKPAGAQGIEFVFYLGDPLTRRSFEIAPEAREHFIEGFCIGLVRQMDIVRCLALGLIVFGSRTEICSNAAQQRFLDYIDQWVDDLQQQEFMYLYQ